MKIVSILFALCTIISCSSQPAKNVSSNDDCKKILAATGLKSPQISARKVEGPWEYKVPITFKREYQCESSKCYDGSFTVKGTHINTTLKYGGALGDNNVKVQIAYMGREAEGSGTCNGTEIIYSYIFTAGPPKGSKGIAKITLE